MSNLGFGDINYKRADKSLQKRPQVVLLGDCRSQSGQGVNLIAPVKETVPKSKKLNRLLLA